MTLLRHGKYGPSSEKADQFELMLEDLEANRAEALAALPPRMKDSAEKGKPSRQPLLDHLPHEDKIYEAPCACPDCGGSAFLKVYTGKRAGVPTDLIENMKVQEGGTRSWGRPTRYRARQALIFTDAPTRPINGKANRLSELEDGATLPPLLCG